MFGELKVTVTGDMTEDGAKGRWRSLSLILEAKDEANTS